MRALRFLVVTVCAVAVVAGLVAPADASARDVTAGPLTSSPSATADGAADGSSSDAGSGGASNAETPSAETGSGDQGDSTAPKSETSGTPSGGASDPAASIPEDAGSQKKTKVASKSESGASASDASVNETVSTGRGASGRKVAAAGISPLAAGAGCDYANPGTGAYANTLCWLDFTGVSTEWVEVSSVTDTISAGQFGSASVCPTTYRTGTSGKNYRRTTKVFESVLGATYGSQTFVGCARNSDLTTASTNSLTRARTARNDVLYTSADTSTDTGTFSGNVTGWPIEIQLSNSYVFRASLDISASAARSVQAVAATGFPTWSGAFLGNNGFYTGITGQPALYQQADAGGTGVSAANRTTTVSLRDIRVQNTTTSSKVTGYSVVVADAESTDGNEQIQWKHVGGTGFLWLPNNPTAWSAATTDAARKTAALGSACGGTAASEFPANSESTLPAASRTCIGTTSGKSGTAMLQISPQNTTDTFTVNQLMQGGGRQGVAFGVVLAGAKLNVNVADRVLDASGNATGANFTGDMTAAGYGTFSAATGTTGTSATTDSQFFPISTASSSSITFASIPPADPTLSSYTKAWSCEKRSGASTTPELWPAAGTSPTPPPGSWTALFGGQFIECTVTYTPPYLTLVKTINTAGTAAANVPGDFTLTATGQSAPVSRVQGAGNAALVTHRPVAVGTYNFSETAPPLTGGANWQYGYTWSDLVCTGGNAATVAKDAASGAVTSASLAVAASQNVTCTYTNTANQPRLKVKKELFAQNGSTAIARDTPVGAGDTITYRLTFDNTAGTAALAVAYTDYLRDVLDDATFVAGSLRYGTTAANPTGTSPITPVGVTATSADMTGTNPRLVITGSVPALSLRTVAFQVTVKSNATDANARQNAAAPLAGYLLRNYLAPTADPIPTSCAVPAPGDLPACTQNPVRAWTLQKSSQPEDGAKIHSGGNIYYRVKITNFSGSDLTGVTVTDNLTQTLAATVWDPAAPPAMPQPNGISFYRADGSRIVSATYDRDWATTGSKPVFSGSTAFDPDFPGGMPFPGGAWTFTTPAFTVPATIGGETVAYAIVGYAVRGGYVADPANPANQYISSGAVVKALPDASWVNTAQAGQASIGGQSLYPNRCSAAGGGIAPGNTGADLDCKTRHSLGESYFHIWKKSANPVGQNLLGSTFVIADTEADARDAVPSRWLCRVENAVPNPNDVNSVPIVAVGSTTAGTPDFGESSATHASIALANQKRAAYNLQNGYTQLDPQYRPQLPQCGQFFYLNAASEGQAAGSWRAVDVRGGDLAPGTNTPLPNWRTASAFNNGIDLSAGRHGTYWLAETVSPTDHQLLAQPMQLWVAPDASSPATGLSPGTPAWYDYQGRLSMPVVGVGETAAPGQGMGGGSLRRECVSPYELPPYQQPACVMPTGWTMPIFDTKMRALPLAGGAGSAMFGALGGLVLLIALGSGFWWRRRRSVSDSLHPIP